MYVSDADSDEEPGAGQSVPTGDRTVRSDAAPDFDGQVPDPSWAFGASARSPMESTSEEEVTEINDVDMISLVTIRSTVNGQRRVRREHQFTTSMALDPLTLTGGT